MEISHIVFNLWKKDKKCLKEAKERKHGILLPAEKQRR